MLVQNGIGRTISRNTRNPPQDGRQLVPCSIRSHMKNLFRQSRQRFPETFGGKHLCRGFPKTPTSLTPFDGPDLLLFDA